MRLSQSRPLLDNLVGNGCTTVNIDWCLVMQDQHVLDDKTGYVFIWSICCQIALVLDHSVGKDDSFALYAVRSQTERRRSEQTRRARRKLAGVTGPFSPMRKNG